MPLDPASVVMIGGIPVYDEDTTEAFGREGSYAERTLLVDWSNRASLATYLLGGNTASGSGTSVTITYGQPAAYPDFPWMFAQSIRSIKGDGTRGTNGTGGMISYQYARMIVVYRPMQFNGDAEYGTEEIDFGTDSQVLSHAYPCFQWVGPGTSRAGLAVNGQPIVRIGVLHFTQEQKSVPALPIRTFMNLLDNVNDAPFMGAPAKQMLFRGGRSQRRYTPMGNAAWDVAMSFSYRTKPWDQHYRTGANPQEGPPGWATVQYTDGTPMYPSGDFSVFNIPETLIT